MVYKTLKRRKEFGGETQFNFSKDSKYYEFIVNHTYSNLDKKSKEFYKDFKMFMVSNNVKPLYEGGYGKIYIFEYKKKKYAVKLGTKLSSNVNRFLQEFEIYEKMKYPMMSIITNISPLIVMQDNQLKYSLMPTRYVLSSDPDINSLVELSDLSYIFYKNLNSFSSNYINRFKKIIYTIYLQLLLSIYYLHSSGIFHKDIKPDNILIDENGYVLLIDFGLVSCLENKGILTKNTCYNGNKPNTETCKFGSNEIGGTSGFISPYLYLDGCENYRGDYYAVIKSVIAILDTTIRQDEFEEGEYTKDADIVYFIKNVKNEFQKFGEMVNFFNTYMGIEYHKLSHFNMSVYGLTTSHLNLDKGDNFPYNLDGMNNIIQIIDKLANSEYKMSRKKFIKQMEKCFNYDMENYLLNKANIDFMKNI